MRDVTVDDAVSMVRLAAPEYFEGSSMKGHVVQFSPDGKNFLLVLRRGVVADYTNEYTVNLFHSYEALHSPKPILLAKMRSSSNEDAIKEVRWSANGRYISFIGTTLHGGTQIYRVDIVTRRLERLTHHGAPVVTRTTARTCSACVRSAHIFVCDTAKS